MTGSYFGISNEHIQGWEIIMFPLSIDLMFTDGLAISDFVGIPDTLILQELVNIPDPKSIGRLMDLFEIDKDIKNEIFKIVNPTWKNITDKLIDWSDSTSENISILKLIRYTLQLAYARPGKVTDESINILKDFSNDLVIKLWHLNHPSKLINKVWNLCKDDPQAAANWTYYSLAIQYCQNILPHPSQPRLSRIRKHKEFTESLFDEQIIIDPQNKEIAKTKVLLYELGSRFSLLPLAIQIKQEIQQTIDPTNTVLKNVEAKQNAKIWSDLEKRGLTTGSRSILCQCLYCWNFRIEETSESSIVQRFCSDMVCNKAHGNKRKYLYRKGLSAESDDE